MVMIERTFDTELVRSIVTHPRVYPYVSDDYSPTPEKWQPIQNEHTIYLAVHEAGRVVGLLILIAQNAVCWRVHVCMLPEGYGQIARDAMRQMFEWTWANTRCIRIVGEVPRRHRKAFQFARRAGMQIFAVNPDSWVKDGRVEDMILFGISKPRLRAVA